MKMHNFTTEPVVFDDRLVETVESFKHLGAVALGFIPSGQEIKS